MKPSFAAHHSASLRRAGAGENETGNRQQDRCLNQKQAQPHPEDQGQGKDHDHENHSGPFASVTDGPVVMPVLNHPAEDLVLHKPLMPTIR